RRLTSGLGGRCRGADRRTRLARRGPDERRELRGGRRCCVVAYATTGDEDMPAVTADTLTLPKVAAPAADARARRVRSITTGPTGFEGEGFPVRRTFAGVPSAELDPFIMMDQ